MAIKSILLAVDGSAEARYAAEVAWLIAEANKAPITAQHVINTQLLWKALLHHKAGFIGSGPYFEAYEPTVARLRTIGQTLLDAYESFVPRGLTSSSLLSEGSVKEQILVQLEQCDMLVIGHRHEGDVNDPSWSLAAQIVESCNKPVLVVQNQTKPWSAGRLIVGDSGLKCDFIGDLMKLMTSLKLRKEVYCLPSANLETATDLTRRTKELAAPANETIFVHNAIHRADYERYGTSAEEDTLIVIPKVLSATEEQTALGTKPLELMQQYAGNSLLFWPAQASEPAEDRAIGHVVVSK